MFRSKLRARALTKISAFILTTAAAMSFSPFFAKQEAQTKQRLFYPQSQETKANDNISTTTTGQCVAPPAGLVAWYSGDDTPGDVLNSIYSLTLKNGATYANGKVGRAFSFDGIDDYAEQAFSGSTNPPTFQNSNLNIADKVTISFWAKRQDLTRNDVVVEKGGDIDDGLTNYGVGLNNVNNNMFYFFHAGGYKGVDGVNDTDWHHYSVVAVHGQSNPKFYIDGVEKPILYTFGDANINLYQNTNTLLHIGAQKTSGINYYSKTLLDEVMIFRNTLTSGNVQALFNAGSAGACRNIAYVPPTPNGRVLYRNFADVYSMEADGSSRTKITTLPQSPTNAFLKWSPNGGRFSYWFPNIDSTSYAFVINTDGSGAVRFPYSPVSYVNWSPDGTKLLFTYQNAATGNKPEIFSANLDGTNLTRISTTTNPTNTNFNNYNSESSPDGSKIVFVSTRDGNNEIYVMNADGTSPLRLTTSSPNEDFPTWSPDGSKIVFIRQASGANPTRIYTIKPDGTGLTLVYNSSTLVSGYNLSFTTIGWSQDGTKIIVPGNNGFGNRLFLINADGTGTPVQINTGSNYNSLGGDFHVQKPVSQQGVVLTSNPNNVNAPGAATLALTNITQPGTAAFTSIAPSSIGTLPPNYALPAQSVAYEIQSSAQAGNFRVCFNVTGIDDPTVFRNLRVLHNVNGTVVDETSFPHDFPNRKVCANSTSLSPFAVAQNLAPTSATVTASGRVMTADGRGIRNVLVTLIDQNGISRSVMTGAFGNYRFTDVSVGSSYVFSVSSKRYSFEQPTQVVTIQEQNSDINFTTGK